MNGIPLEKNLWMIWGDADSNFESITFFAQPRIRFMAVDPPEGWTECYKLRLLYAGIEDDCCRSCDATTLDLQHVHNGLFQLGIEKLIISAQNWIIKWNLRPSRNNIEKILCVEKILILLLIEVSVVTFMNEK